MLALVRTCMVAIGLIPAACRGVETGNPSMRVLCAARLRPRRCISRTSPRESKSHKADAVPQPLPYLVADPQRTAAPRQGSWRHGLCADMSDDSPLFIAAWYSGGHRHRHGALSIA